MRSVCSILLFELLIVFYAPPSYALLEYDVIFTDPNMDINADVQKIDCLSDQYEVFVIDLPKQIFERLFNNIGEIYRQDEINQDDGLDALLHEALRTNTPLTCKREYSPRDILLWDAVVSMIISDMHINVNINKFAHRPIYLQTFIINDYPIILQVDSSNDLRVYLSGAHCCAKRMNSINKVPGYLLKHYFILDSRADIIGLDVSSVGSYENVYGFRTTKYMYSMPDLSDYELVYVTTGDNFNGLVIIPIATYTKIVQSGGITEVNEEFLESAIFNRYNQDSTDFNMLCDTQTSDYFPVTGYQIIWISMKNGHAIYYTGETDVLDLSWLGIKKRMYEVSEGLDWAVDSLKLAFKMDKYLDIFSSFRKSVVEPDDIDLSIFIENNNVRISDLIDLTYDFNRDVDCLTDIVDIHFPQFSFWRLGFAYDWRFSNSTISLGIPYTNFYSAQPMVRVPEPATILILFLGLGFTFLFRKTKTSTAVRDLTQ